MKESALLIYGRTGGEREIDIGIGPEAAGHPVVVGIEGRDRKRPQFVEWVEQMFAKHQDLPTTLFVLISKSRFSVPAKLKGDALFYY